MHEEYLTNEDGLMVSNSTWTYKIPTIDTIPQNFNVHVVNSGHHKKRVLSSKGIISFPLLFLWSNKFFACSFMTADVMKNSYTHSSLQNVSFDQHGICMFIHRQWWIKNEFHMNLDPSLYVQTV